MLCYYVFIIVTLLFEECTYLEFIYAFNITKTKMYKLIFAVSEKKIRVLLFSIGLSLTLWRGYECLQKYFQANLSVQINMVDSHQTFVPSLTICPEYSRAYSETNLNKIGIGKANDYRKGEWYGNSTLDGSRIFQYVTHNFSDLVQSFSIRFKKGEKLIYSGFSKDLKVTEKGHYTFGRCFETQQMDKNDSIYTYDIMFSKSIYIYFNMPQQFYNDDSKSKIQANVGERQYLDITYEILKNNFAKNCKSYNSNSYDFCKATEIENIIWAKFNCTVPFLTTSTVNVCNMKKISGEASKYFYKLIYTKLDQCPSPCTNMMTNLGLPSVTKDDAKIGFVRLYFKSIVKITEDFVSYDLLR